jgi:hypothetical protein
MDECPAIPAMQAGETWAEYEVRAEEFAKQWREENGVEDVR